MLPVLCMLTLAAAPPPDDPSEALVAAARAAEAAGDGAQATRMLRAWASLRPRADLPRGLEEPAAEALGFIEARGRLRLFGNWRGGLVRVGLQDPADIVARVDVWAQRDGQRVRLTRIGETSEGRGLYRLDEATDREVVLEAVALIDGRPWVVARTRLRADAAAVPTPPDPDALARRLTAPPPPSGAPSPKPAIRWWWIAAGVAAVALTGAAVVQEVD